MNKNHPWQSGPTEIIKYALIHLHKEDDFSQRISFLLLDVGVETVFKTFLQLPKEVTGTKVSFSERTKASEGNFHELTDGIRKAAGNRLANIDLTHIQFYHELRNKLYHQGNGITVPPEKTKEYASLVVECLKALLDVDLHPLLFVKQTEEQLQAKVIVKHEEFETARQELKTLLKYLLDSVELTLEKNEPTLIMPSFRKQFETWTEIFGAQYHAWVSKMWLEQMIQKIDFEGKFQPQQYASFLDEIHPSMPKPFQDFVNKHHLKGDDVIYLATCNDFEEVLLTMAIVVLKIPVDIRAFYFTADFITRQKTINLPAIMPFLGNDIEDPVSELIKQTKDSINEAKKLIETLNTFTNTL